MKMKNLVAYAMLALGAVAAPFAATAADLDGHIRSINAMPNVEQSMMFPNPTAPLKAGQDVYILIRLLNANYVQEMTGAAVKPWYFKAAAGVGSTTLADSMYRPQIGLSVGGRRRYATFSETGPDGLVSGPNEECKYYTDLYFKYTVKTGDLGLPIKMLQANGKIGTDFGDFMLVNANTDGITYNPWDLTNDHDGSLVKFRYGPETVPVSGRPTKPKAAEVRTYDFQSEGVYVKAVDFDGNYDDGAGTVWRYAYPSPMPAQVIVYEPKVVGMGSGEDDSTVYLWSDDESVFTPWPLSGDETEFISVAGRRVLPVTILRGDTEAKFLLKGGTAAAGSSATIYMSPTTTDGQSAVGEQLAGAAVTRTVALKAPPPPTVSFEVIPTTVDCKTNYEDYAAQLMVKVSPLVDHDFKVKINASLDGTGNLAEIFDANLLGISLSASGAAYEDRETEVTIPANTPAVPLYLYTLGWNSKTTGKGIKFTPSTDDTTVEVKATPATLFVKKSTPTVVSVNPTEAAVKPGRSTTFTLALSDCYMNLQGAESDYIFTFESPDGAFDPMDNFNGDFEYVYLGDGEFEMDPMFDLPAGEFAAKITVASPNNQKCTANVTLKVGEQPSLQATVNGASSGIKVAEGGVLPVKFKLEGQTRSSDSYAFLVPQGDSGAYVNTTIAPFAKGVRVPKNNYDAVDMPEIEFLDGTQSLSFKVTLSSKEDTVQKVTGYDQGDLFITVTNVLPYVTYVTAAGHPVSNGGTSEAVPKGVETSIAVGAWDVPADLDCVATGKKFLTKVVVYDGTAKSYEHEGNPEGFVFKHMFLNDTIGKEGTLVHVYVKDKDTSAYPVVPNWTFRVPVNDTPRVTLAYGGTYDAGVWPETEVNVHSVVVGLTVAAPVELQLSVTAPKAGDGGYLKFKTNSRVQFVSEGVYSVTLPAGQTAQELIVSEMDGTGDTAGGVELNARVITDSDSGYGKRWSEYYEAAAPLMPRVQNVAPIPSIPMENAPTNDNFAAFKPFYVTYKLASEVPADLAAGVTVKLAVDGNDKETVTGLKDKNSHEFATQVEFTTPGAHSVTVTFYDKDDQDYGTARTIWYIVLPTKAMEVRAHGPADRMTTPNGHSRRYGQAAGLGAGRIASAQAPQSVKAWAYSFSASVTEASMPMTATGYSVGDVDTAIDSNGNFPKTSGSDFNYDTQTEAGQRGLDSFLYAWVYDNAKASDGVEVEVTSMVDPGKSGTFAIPLQDYSKDKIAYDMQYWEAVFSREWLPSDNCGDINQDGIPDIYLTYTGWKAQFSAAFDQAGALVGNDLEKLSDFNVDEDYLPTLEVSSYGALIPGLPGTWLETGTPFNARTEIRGYGDGLNDAPAQVGITGVKPDRVYTDPDVDPNSTLSKLEYLAWRESGLPKEQWSPECPSDPTKIDTDGDGYPDGYEYFFWYKAHVGYLDGNGRHRYLTGRRFDPQAPSVGRLITPKEIEAIFNPREPVDKSAALTRDTDNDGLPDLIEFELGTDPLHWDTDGDGLPDGYEVAMLGREAEGGTIGEITTAGERKFIFDPLGNSGVDEAMYNGDNDAMAYLPVSKGKVMISGFLQGDGSVRWYWLSGGTNVVSATTTPGFKLVVEETDEEGETTLSTNVTTAAAAALVKPLDGKWVLTRMLTEDECWAAKELAEGLSRGAPSALACGTRLAEAPAACEIVNVTVEGAKGPCYRVWQYGPRVYGEEQPYGQWVCGAETVTGFKDKPCVATQEVNLFNIHTHAYQGVAAGTDMKDAWHPEFGWGEAMPFTQLDEFLVCFWHYLDDQPEASLGSPMKMTPDRGRSWINIWSDYCTDPSTADTDGDGMPDGWELYVLGGPKAYGEKPGARKRNYGPLGVNSAKNPTGEFASEFHGSTCSLYFGPYCQSIIDSYLVTHPFWTNKKQPTDPWTDDTDGDGIPDGEEEGLFAYLQETEQWQGREPSYPDAIPAPGAGGGLDPLSWDTDLDGLPDPWEVQYGTGKALDASASYAYVGKNPSAEMKVLPESLERWCREDGFGRMVPTVDGTVSDASEDYDHDGLLNWQEYLVNAMRCWRYDDTISSWENLSGLDDSIDWGERLVIGGVIRQKNEDGTTSTILAGITPGTEEYDGQSPYYNPHILVSGTYDIGANWFSLCTNAFDQAAGRWYMFYDGVYHDLTTPDKSKWTVTGGQEMNFNRFTWRSYTLQQRSGNPLFFSATQWGQAADGLYYWGDAEGGNYVVAPKEYPGTDPNLADTDYDGMDDYWELFHGLNPLLGESRSYNNGHRPAVDRVFEAYGGCRDPYPKNGSWIEYPSAENNYWTALNRLEPNSPHFPKAFPDYRTKGNSSYDFHRFPWLNGLAAADPDGDDIRNQQESIQSMLQANASYLHTDPSPLWMTDKSYSYSLTHRYYRPLEIGSYKDPMAPASFTDQFGNEHKWEEFPGFTYNPDEGLVTPRYDFTSWEAPSPSSSKHDNIAPIRVSSYGWDFEEDEGYDSDKDYLSDFEEGQSRTKPASNPQDADDPTRRQAMYFGGPTAKSLLQTPLEEGVTAVNDTVPVHPDQPFLYFTVECWAKPEGNLNRDQVLVERTIWSSESNPADEKFLRKNFQIGIRASEQGALWYAKYDSSGTGARDSVEISDGPEVTTNWTHVAATYDGTHLRLYIDGVELRKQPSNLQPEHGFRNASVDYDGTFKEGSDEYGADRRTITVGASVCAYNGINLANKDNSWSCYNQYYQGYIDEVRIWDGARTATEILESYKKRFTAADALDNRQTVFSRWSIGYTREPISSGILPAELKYHWTFDHLPGATQADWVMRQPAGFTTPDDVEDGRAIWSRPDGWAEPWWNSVRPKSLVYDDRAWIPWIVDTVHHLPRFDGTTVDSSYWSENYQGDLSVLGWATNYMGTEAASTYAKFDFQRTHELPSRWTQVTFSDGPPYAIDRRYTLVCKLVEQGAPDGEAMMKSYAFTQRHALKAGYDLLPLGCAYPKRISAAEGGMWDDQGAADAWAQTGNGNDPLVDPTNKGLPDWWTEYYLQQNPELDPDTVITWDTVIEYNGMRIPAWQAYLRDLAEGLLPDGKKHTNEFADTRDMNGNGLPDWWEEFWKLGNTDADGDPDNDGLSTFAEWLATEGDYPYNVTNGFPRLNPTLTYSTPLKVTDYFLAGPTQNLDAAGKHIYAGEYLGEIFSDHDFMEDWWENLYSRTYADSKKYDPLADKDEDGWSNWAECRAALWGNYFNAELIDEWMGMQSEQHVTDYPEPTIALRVTYHGIRDISGHGEQDNQENYGAGPNSANGHHLVVRTISGQSPRVDATFVVPTVPSSQTRYLGPFKGDKIMHGQLSPGHLNGNSIIFERANIGSDKTYFWSWEWYDRQNIQHPDTVVGSFESYRYWYSLYPHIQLQGAELNWESFTISVDSLTGTADILLNGNSFGTIDTVTGEYELDMSKFDKNLSDYTFRVTYASRIGHEWPQTVYLSDSKELSTGSNDEYFGNGRVREGRNVIEAFMDLNNNAEYDEGEPYGVVRNVQIGWHKTAEVVLELSDDSAIMPRVLLKQEDEGDDGAAADDGAVEKPVASTLTKTVRVTRRLVNGISENEGKHLTERQLLTKSVVLDDHPYLTESDVVIVNKPDLDWSWLARDAKKFGIEKIETVTYSVDEVSQLADGTMEEKTLATFVKTFSAARTVATPVSPIEMAPVYSASPTFAFAASDDKATGYRLQVRTRDGVTIYDSDFRLLPGRTGSTVGKPVYEVTPPIFVNREVIAGVTTNRAVLADGADYQWRVALVNAKYNTVDENSYSPWADFQMDVANRNRYPQQPTGYGLVPLAVRYFGPLAVTNGTIASSNVVVEAYENADFRGQPLAQLRIADIGNIANRANVSATDVILRGIRPGRVFLCAYIDQNQNGVRDRWESWGYANMVGKGMRAIYNPDSYEVSASAADWVNAEKGVAARVIYIEDCDVNQNEKPDCIDSDGDFTADMPYWDEPDTSMAMSEDPLADTDGDGMPDVWEVWNDGVTDPLVADGETLPEDGTDVMAYLEEMRTMLTLDDGTTEGRRLLLAEGETFNPKDGKVASNYTYTTWYLYGPINDKTQVYGVGTNLVVTNSWPVKSAAEVKVALVHAQVYGKKGYSVLTANPGAFDAGTAVDTKEFTALDRYLVMRYFEAIGATPKDYPSKYKSYEDYALTMGSAEWSKWTLMPGKVDANNDFVADGWQLYVMYGTNLVNGVARGDRGKTSPWGSIMDTTKPAPDAGGLTWRQEFDDGGIPSDPWDAYSLYKSLKELGLLYEGTPEFSDAEAKDRISFEALTSDLDGDNDQITDFQEWQAFLYDRALLAGLNIANAWSDGLTPDYFRNFTNRTDSTTNYLGAAFNGGEWIEPSMRTALGMSGTAGVGTRDYNASGWDYWSVVRNSLHEADTNSVSELSDILPIINSTLNYQGNESHDVIVEAYQATSAYPLYGGQLTAKWTATAEFSGGIARITLDESNLMEGLLRQGPARIVAYIDKDGDGKCSTGDIYTITDTEVGYLGVDLALTLVNGATAALPIIDITAETNGVQTVAIIRTKINGEYVTPRGVMLRRYENNLSRKVLYPKDFVTDDFIGLDKYLAKDPTAADPSTDALDKIDSVTYEIVKIPSSRVIGEGDDDAKISTTNLNHYTVAVLDENGDPALDENGKEITETFDQQVNEEYTLVYSIKRDVPETVIADAASTAGKVAVAFTVPTDRAVTKFWYEISGKTADGASYSKVAEAEKKGLLLPDAIGDRIFIDLADYGVFLDEGEYSIRIALGNDKFPERPDDDEGWSAKATFGVNAANAAAGKISVQVRHALEYVNEGLTNGVTVALYTRADLVNPVLVVTNEKANAAIEIPNLVPGKGYYVAAWYVKNPGDGRDDATVRKPHDSWGYYCTLNVTNETLVALSPAFDPVKIEAVKTVTETNTIYLQDTDWNANGVIDRLENIKSVIGRKDAELPVVGDLDCDGIMDEDDDDPVFDNADDWLEGDVMAYQLKRMLCVQIGTVDIETNWVWYAVTDLAAETTTNKLDGGTIVIPRGTPANELKSLYTTYVYGNKKSSPYGIGTNVVGLAGQVYHYEWKDIALVHHQVYVENGFNPYTANALLAVSNAVNTKKFLKLDKYIVTNYLAAIGALAPTEALTNWVLRVSDKKTKFNIDTDRDGIPDGWELYTMFGTNAVQALTKTAKNDVLNAWVAGDRNNDPDGDELTNLHEYNGGQEPTDPWNKYSMYENLAKMGLLLPGTPMFTDKVAKRFGLTAETANEDGDLDFISNIQEMTAYYRDPTALADLSVTNAWSDGSTPDYFRVCGSKYLGELFNGAEFIEPMARRALGLTAFERIGTRDYDDSGWDLWSIVRHSLNKEEEEGASTVSKQLTLIIKYLDVVVPGEYTGDKTLVSVREFVNGLWPTTGLITSQDIVDFFGGELAMQQVIAINTPDLAVEDFEIPAPAVNLTLKYAGNAPQNIVVEAYQVSSMYPEYGEQLSAKWSLTPNFDAGVSKVKLESPSEGSLKQGRTRFLAYVDKDSSVSFSAGDTFGTVDVNVGYLGADVEIALGEANPALPAIALATDSNTVSTIAFVRTKINGEELVGENGKLAPRGVFLRRYWNNLNRDCLYPEDYMTDGFIGIDPKLAEDFADEEALESVESVTYEVVKLYADKATLDGDAWHVTVSNLNAYSYLIKHDLGLGQESNEVVRVETGNGNEEITIHYSLRRDIPREVRGFAGSTDGDALVSFRIPTDGVANTKFWLVVNDDLKGGERGFPLVGAADGVVVLDSAWFEARNITLRSGDNTVKVALGNDKYGCPDKLSAVATFSVNAAAVRTGKLAVKVGHPTASGLTNLTVAVYEKADLAEPVAFMSGCDAGETVVISNLRANAEYFVAAWNVKNPADGRDATMKYRMPYDTWGYFTKLGEGANGFDAKAVKAELAPSVTNAIFLQDTDWNDNGVIDRDEDFKSVAGETKPVAPGAGDAITDIDMDGVGDSEDDDFIVDNGDEVLENDVMAYATKEFFCVKIGTNEQSAAWYAITDLAKETTTNKLTGGKVTIPRGTPAEELKSLRSTYTYGTKRSAPTGLGTNVTFAAAADGVTNIVYDIAYKTLVLVHAQVYDEFGFNPNTANASIAPTEWVNTKGFTKSDKTAVAYYLAGIGAIPAATTNWVLSTKRIDFDYDGIDDGFELYVMFGTNGYQAATMTHSPWIYADRNADVDEDGLDLLHEYDKGQEPTDPWSVDTDRDGISDAHAYAYGLKGERYREDDDNDGLSNFQEFLSSVALTNSLGTPVVDFNRRKTYEKDGQMVPDYFLRVGSLYLGEILGDHDFVEDWLEDDETLFSGDRKASRYQYDAHADYDGNGWDNWSEARAYLAAGSYTAYDVVTNGSEIVSNAYEVSNYTGRPTPTGRIKVVYSGEKYRTSLGDVVVQAYRYRDGKAPSLMVAPDATWTMPMTGVNDWYELSTPTNGYVCGGKNVFAVFNDVNRDGVWTAGEPYGVLDAVDVGYVSIPDSVVEVTDCNPSMMRLDLAGALAANDSAAQAALNDRGVNGFNSEANISVAPNNYQNPLDTTTHVRVRLVRHQVNRQSSYYNTVDRKTYYVGEVLMDRYVDVSQVAPLTEAVLLEQGVPDLDWGTGLPNLCYYQNIKFSELASIAYALIVGEEEWTPAKALSACNCLSTVFVNAFEIGDEQTKAAPLSVSFEDEACRPTFRWRHDQTRKSYPAFRLRIWDSATAVYDSGVQRVPVRDADGVYQWTAPAYIGNQLENGKAYEFSVSMLDAKFMTPNTSETKMSFRAEANGVGGDLSDQYSIFTAVKYFGPVETNKTIRVEAFASPDFAGLPASATTVRNCNDLMSTNSVTLNAQLIGLEAGKPYYVRAFIDSNENGVKDDIESWGYGNYVDSDRKDLYTPRAYVAKKGSFQMPEAVVYIEDVDRNNDGIPDARTDLTAPKADSPYIVTYDAGTETLIATNVFKAMGDDAALLPFVSQLHSFENGDTFSSFQLYFAMAQGSVPSVDQLKTESDVRVTSFSLEDGIKLAISTRTTVDGKTLLPKVSGLSYSVKIKVKVEFVNDLNGGWTSLGETDPIVVSVNAVSEELDPASLQSVNDAIADKTSGLSGFFKVTAEVAE